MFPDTHQNLVIVEPIANDVLELKNGVKFLLSGVNAKTSPPVTGIVRKVPKVLDNELMDWETTIEIKEGDEVVFHYLSAMAAYDQDMFIEVDGVFCFLVPYYQLFAAKRLEKKDNGKEGFEYDSWYEERITPLNGFVLCEDVVEDVIGSDVLSIPNHLRYKTNIDKAKVILTGSCNGKYKGYPDHQDDPTIKNGDIVLLDRFSLIKLEFWTKFFPKPVYKIQRNLILCKL